MPIEGDTQNFKIVVTGPVGAGKTTFITTISEIETVSTEAAISDGQGRTEDKTTTTVGIDFGRLSLAGGLELHLFGTPGQQRFDFMWDIVSQGMLGYILLVDSSKPATHAAAKDIYDHFKAQSDVPAIVAANKVKDFPKEHKAIVSALGLTDDDFVVPTDALDPRAVKQTLIELLELVVAGLAEVSAPA
jgi:uncharacterized protein